VVTSETCFEAADLGHPLIGTEDRVRNDIRLNDSLRLLMISGSNMSGKSTILRTVGINAVLALSGAPVCAGKLRVSPFSIGTAMRFSDSLEHGTSYFCAVITRLRRVMELQDLERPVLFLIDEILQGTNSGDRIEGTKALIRRLLERGGMGMITTHDLELTRIVDTCDGRATNVHFVDQLLDGEIQFDYQMRPGVVRKGNALALMRSMGLDV
jgi:DNA mismatch repair ATPase MutS